MSNILVTGAAGFIGSHTAERLLRAGHHVTALDNLEMGTWDNLAAVKAHVECVLADVRDCDALQRICADRRFDAVIHLAAWTSPPASIDHPLATHATNVTGTLNVLEAVRCSGVRRLVVASSASVYGVSPPLPCHEDALPRPASPYAAQKAECELLCQAYRAVWEIETVPLRYFNVFGRRQPAGSPYSGFVAIAADHISRGQAITVFGDGEQTRDFIHVSDVAAANERAATGADPGAGPINIARGEQVSLLTLISTLRAILRADATLRFTTTRPGDVRHSVADVTRMHTHLGAAQTSLRDGLRNLVSG